MVPSSIPFLSGRREGENKRAFLSLVLKEGKQGLGAGEGLCHASADQHIQIGDTHVPHIQHSDPAVFFIAFSRTQPTCRPQKGGCFSLMCEESLLTSEGSQEQHRGGFTVYWSVKYQFIFCYCCCLKLVPFSKEITRTIHQFLCLLLFIITSLTFLFVSFKICDFFFPST